MEIEILPGLEAVRRRPQLYVGELKRKDLFDDLILESLCHAIDEAVDSNCHTISIQLEPTGAIFVQYDASISLEIHPKSGKRFADVLLTEISACHNLKKRIEIGSEYCQYGLAVLNTLCYEFQVKTVWRGQCGSQFYAEGKKDKDFVISPSDSADNTIFRFFFDEQLLGHHEVHLNNLQMKMEKLEQAMGSQLHITCSSGVPT
ncbi:MAG: hypothetical protein F6J95_015270 [Leptolyngbya sp. SIO1E4]|nr:hypothetical protein [Leptolyngbya sp. SIO1E4]